MLVYWDLAALWNFAADYLLLLGSIRLAGLSPQRRRLAGAAALGAAYSVAALALRLPGWTVLPALGLMCRAAFGATKRFWKLTLLFALLSCGLSGGVLLLEGVGGAEGLGRDLFLGRVSWTAFLAAGTLCYLLLTLVFRGDAAADGAARVSATLTLDGESVTLTLLRDTGNALSDPATGKSVPVVAREAAAPLFEGENAPYSAFTTLRCRTVSGAGELAAFRCDGLWIDGRALGPRLVALCESPPGGGCQGLWNEREDEDGLEAALGPNTGVA